MTAADRFATGLQAVWGLYVAAVLLLGAAYLVARGLSRPRRRYLFESDLMGPWSERKPGDL